MFFHLVGTIFYIALTVMDVAYGMESFLMRGPPAEKIVKALIGLVHFSFYFKIIISSFHKHFSLFLAWSYNRIKIVNNWSSGGDLLRCGGLPRHRESCWSPSTPLPHFCRQYIKVHFKRTPFFKQVNMLPTYLLCPT